MVKSAVKALQGILNAETQVADQDGATPLRAYRVYCVLAGVLVTGFWIAYRLASPDYIDPFSVRLLLAGACGALIAASFVSERVAATFDRWVFGLFCVLGVWFVTISAINDFATDYAVGLLFVIAAISLALSLTTGPRSRLLVFQLFMILALGIAFVVSRQSLLAQLILFCCVVGIAIVTGVGSSVRSRMEKARAKYREGLTQANERAEELLRLKSAFLNNMNHEIRTPLTGILGYAEILAENADPDQLECADAIRASGQRLLDTLSTILDLASLEAGEFDLDNGHVDLESAVEDAVNLLRATAEKRGVSINVAPAARPVVARGDHSAVRRVVYHILSNAVKFTTEGSVTVRAFSTGSSVCVEITDTGIGIDPAFIPHLFGEFKQASSGLARTHEGSGLGLAISRRLADLMDGHIGVKSEPGVGSTFTLSLPVYVPRLMSAVV